MKQLKVQKGNFFKEDIDHSEDVLVEYLMLIHHSSLQNPLSNLGSWIFYVEAESRSPPVNRCGLETSIYTAVKYELWT